MINPRRVKRQGEENSALLLQHVADADAHHDTVDIFSPIYTEGSAGFTRGALYFDVAHSDVNAYVAANFICPETRTDWKFVVTHYATPNLATDSGTQRVGVQGDGEAFDSDSEISETNMDLVNTAAATVYQTESSTFSATKGDLIMTRWTKDDNAGGAAGNLRIFGIHLTY